MSRIIKVDRCDICPYFEKHDGYFICKNNGELVDYIELNFNPFVSIYKYCLLPLEK